MAGGNSLEGREQKKGIAVNTLYTMGGLLFMNAVLQIVITPLLNRMMGAEQLGGLLYITGLVAIICPSIGQALNNSRLVVRRDFDVTNGDYDWKYCCTVYVRQKPGKSVDGSWRFPDVYADCIPLLW